MTDKLISFLGICNRAGKMTFGYDRTEKAVLSSSTELIITASDFSNKSEGKLIRMCNEKNIPLIKVNYTTDELYYLLSYRAGVIGITDKGFADRIKQLLQNEK